MSAAKAERWIVIGLVQLGLALLAYPLLRLFWDFEIDYNEGWNAYHQLRASAGHALYAPASALVFNNYPPLSFQLIGALARAFGDPVRAGRVVSLLSLLVVASACYVVARALGARRRHAALAFAMCLGAFACFATDYVGMNDPQLLAHAFSCVGLAAYARYGRSASVAASVPLWFALGLSTKHNVLPLPLLVSLHALFCRSGRVRRAYVASALLLALGALALLHGARGTALLRALGAPRLYDFAAGLHLTARCLGAAWLAIGSVAAGLLVARDRAPARWLLAYLVLSLALGLGFAGGAGVDVNVFFDVFIAVALGTAVVAGELERRAPAPALAAAFALLVHAGVLCAAPQQLAHVSTSGVRALAQAERRFRADVAYLRAAPGPVLCESMLLCLRAGKTPFYDPFNVLQATQTGGLAPDTATRLLDDAKVAVVQLSSQPPASERPEHFANFSRAFFAALERNYVVVRRGACGRFYVSAPARVAQREPRDRSLPAAWTADASNTLHIRARLGLSSAHALEAQPSLSWHRARRLRRPFRLR